MILYKCDMCGETHEMKFKDFEKEMQGAGYTVKTLDEQYSGKSLFELYRKGGKPLYVVWDFNDDSYRVYMCYGLALDDLNS